MMSYHYFKISTSIRSGCKRLDANWQGNQSLGKQSGEGSRSKVAVCDGEASSSSSIR